MYRSGEPEHGFDHRFSVLEIVEQHVWLMRLELGARKVACGDRYDPGATRPRAGDVERRVADHDDIGGADLLAEAVFEALATDWHQARSISVVRAVRAEVEVDITIEAHAGELEAGDWLEIAGE